MEITFGLLSALKICTGIFIYVLVSYALPREYICAKMQKHYRGWIVVSEAYWGRSYDKWIIYNRIFYKDEFFGDIFTSISLGLLGSVVGFAVLFSYDSRGVELIDVMVTFASTSIWIFCLLQYARVKIIDSELTIRKLVDPKFDKNSRLKQGIAYNPTFVKKVIKSSI